MCIFTAPPASDAVSVGGTHIFARVDVDGWQWLAYEMAVALRTPAAMVLPVPIASQRTDDFALVDLSGYPSLFDDLVRALPVWHRRRFNIALGAGGPSREKLPVHQVGAYEASFVPHRADFARLDARFRIDPELWNELPDYDAFAFAVFKLAETRAAIRQRVHAMAFRFRTGLPGSLFFPTVHVHDGHRQPHARFDHTLYLQGPHFALPQERYFVDGEEMEYLAIRRDLIGGLRNQAHESESDTGKLSGRFGGLRAAGFGVANGAAPVVDPARAAGLVDPGQPIFGLGLSGLMPNVDTTVPIAAGPMPPLNAAGAAAVPPGDFLEIEK